MDEEITCAICQKSLDNVNDVVIREVRELTERAESAMTSYKLFQVKKYTKQAAANTATQIKLTELRKKFNN